MKILVSLSAKYIPKKIRALTEEQQEKIIEDYKAGKSAEALGKEYKVNSVTIMNVIRKHGHEPRTTAGNKAIPADIKQKIVDSYINGDSIKTIADRHGISLTGAFKTLRENNVDTSLRRKQNKSTMTVVEAIELLKGKKSTDLVKIVFIKDKNT